MKLGWHKPTWLVFGVGIILVVIGIIWNLMLTPSASSAKIIIADTTLDIEIARTVDQQAKGLGGRTCGLTDSQGMLFDFGQPAAPSFWMKDMKFPLDIIWITDNKVVGWEASVSIDDQTKKYFPPQPVNQVLEVSAGWAEREHLTLGSRVSDVIK